MLNKGIISTVSFYIVLAGLLTDPFSAFGQCQIKVVEETDSSLVFEAQSFEGIALTKNRALGVMTNIHGNEAAVTIKTITELPRSARIVRPTLQEICSFETAFDDWWNHKPNRARIQLRSVSVKKDAIYRFNRQYIAYFHNTKKYIQATLFHSRTIPEREWKTKPITCGHCWPDIFMLNYDVEEQRVTLNTNFK